MTRKRKAPKTSTKTATSTSASQPAPSSSATAVSAPSSAAKPGRARKISASKKSGPKRAGPGKRYSPVVKAAILKTIVAAREAGKTWGDALKAAKQKGYGGSEQGLMQMARASKPKKTAAAKSAKPKSKPGIPPATELNGLGEIHQAIEKLVREQVRQALNRAIQVLEQAI